MQLTIITRFVGGFRLPIDAATGEAIYAEASLKGKKKDAVVMCALNACRMLDAQDMLRHSAKGGGRF